MKQMTEHLLLYAVTDRAGAGLPLFLARIEAALAGGVTCVQLREKHLDEDAFTAEAIQVKKLCQSYGVPLLINDNLNVALNSRADGIHVGQADCPVREIRKRAGRDFIIGATAKTVAQAQKAEADGADYLGIGAVFPSPTKADAIRITTEDLKQICRSVSVPAIAIGGICHENISLLQGSGICGIAAVSALFSAEDVKEAAQKLKKDVLKILQKND